MDRMRRLHAASSRRNNFAGVWWVVVLALVEPAAFAQSSADNGDAARTIITVNTDVVVRAELPSTLFGFNINHYYFQRDLWQEEECRVNPPVVEALKPMSGAIYRYPGGLVANRFWWERAIGPHADRGVQRSVEWQPAGPVHFGVEEYFDFVADVGGVPWYVLNLVGWDTDAMIRKLPANEVARSNAALAEFVMRQNDRFEYPTYYQLGNELDRSDYQWPHDEYVERSRATMDAILDVDPDARFVAFMRDYDFTYSTQERAGEVSRYEDLFADVLQGLPEINDFSLHFYYDDVGMEDRRFKRIASRLSNFRSAFNAAARQRGGKTPNVWITEHARGIGTGPDRAKSRRRLMDNLSATISTADFLIAIAQVPEIKGAVWHGLNAGPWEVFDATTEQGDLRPRPIYYGLRVLRSAHLPVVLATSTRSSNFSKYGGGYDVRAVALTDPARERIALWVANRAARTLPVEVVLDRWNSQSVSIRHRYLAGREGVNPDANDLEPIVVLHPPPISKEVSDAGVLELELPPASVSSFVIESFPDAP